MIPHIGQQASYSRRISEEDVVQFADISGDRNPLHLDDDFAKKTRFGRRIAHGMLVASLISTVLGSKLPGPGTIYLSQTIKFTAPVFLGDTIKATVTVVDVKEHKPIVTLETHCSNQDGEVVLEGEAVVVVEKVDIRG